MSLGTQIQIYRKRAHLSQEQLAEQLGVSRQAVTKWENGQSSPSTKNLAQLAGILGVSLDELAGMTAEAGMETEEAAEAAVSESQAPGKKSSVRRIFIGILVVLVAGLFLCFLVGGQLMADFAITVINLLLLGGFVYVLVLAVKALKRIGGG
ncbi:helix-turn-helix domain-containing protein [Clostridium sp. MCC353]|uniref:helix-turn-helix domain-containing protein n=1 Tax=Clostridium sp. MCC353 TaxID=2592646 RepID=UPI001C026192|nr:helix-turn-helix transcriptional regulator [Clostridium sp. MCC353]MBT9775661.1 helix-turn-helix domain-containing protein [Clostridium sp. MCC353]